MGYKKKLLIAGGGYADIPLIKAAKKLNFHVITSGNRPDELGHQESDEYHAADFSDPGAMLELTANLKIDAICSSCNDFSATSSAYVAERIGLPGHDPYKTAQLIHHKDSYREFALANGIPTPRAKGFVDVESALLEVNNFRFPVIIKPVDLTGGKGISKVENLSGARQALDKAFALSKSKRVVVEEFVVGSRHGFSAFLWEGKVIFHFSDNEHYYLNQYMVSAASTPSVAPAKAIDLLICQTEKIASLLSLKAGVFHVQFILHDNQPVIIEICRRSPGDLYIKFVEHATGVDYASWIVKASAGLDCSALSQTAVRGYIARHVVMAEQIGFLREVVIDPNIKKNIIDEFMWWKPGDRIENYLTAKFGIVFLKFDSMEEMLRNTDNMQSLIHTQVTPF
jgi:biotin carboxylase